MADLPRRALLATPLLMAAAPVQTVFDFRLEALEGGALPLADFRGQALMLVNTASFCGFTRQYEGLQALHERFAARGFSVIGVPSNDFRQESADAARIREFCETVYGITFPLAGVTAVRGPSAHPLFAWLATRAGGPPRWNFHKYLVARDGSTVRAFPSSEEPGGAPIIRAVEAALAGRPMA